MSHFSEGQVHLLVDSMEAHGFTSEQLTGLGQNRDGVLDNLRLVLMGLASIVRSCFKLACDKALNVTEFVGKDWRVWKGPVNGKGLEGEEDRDVREEALTTIDWEKVILETNLQGKETYVKGEEKLLRLKAGNNIRLGGKAFLSLWEDYKANGANSILEKLRLKGVTRIYFFGLVLRNPRGDRRVLCLYFNGSEWRWDCSWLGSDFYSGSPSASLASV